MKTTPSNPAPICAPAQQETSDSGSSNREPVSFVVGEEHESMVAFVYAPLKCHIAVSIPYFNQRGISLTPQQRIDIRAAIKQQISTPHSTPPTSESHGGELSR